MNTTLTPREFYEQTLKASGVTPPPDEIQKVAEAKGVPVEVAKLARAFFEQLQLDCVPYPNEVERGNDAMKMAQAYVEHVKEVNEGAVKVADGLLRFLLHQAEGYLSQNNIELSATEAVKIAGLQAESADIWDDEIKTANADREAKLANIPKDLKVPPPSKEAGIAGPGQDPAVLNFQDLGAQHLGPAAAGLSPAELQPQLAGRMGLRPDAAGHEILARGRDLNALRAIHGDLPVHELLRLGTPAQPSWLSRNAGMLGVGALGAGALYMLHKRHQENQEAKEREMNALRAAALPAL